MTDYKDMIISLTHAQLGVLEDDLHCHLDELSDDIGSLESQIEGIWEEYSWYDSQTGDYNLTGNAEHYEENLQGELRGLEEDVKRTEAQLSDVLKRLEELNV